MLNSIHLGQTISQKVAGSTQIVPSAAKAAFIRRGAYGLKAVPFKKLSSSAAWLVWPWYKA
jgi:hypothetical protein